MDDLQSIALKILETEKRYLQEDRDDYYASGIVVVTPERRYYEDVDFEDEESKIAAYTAAVERAKQENATAIITINTARQTNVASGDDMDGYWWGKLQAGDYPRAIVLTISGPGIPAWSVCLPFRVVKGAVELGRVTDFQNAELGLLPNWPTADGGRTNPVEN